MRLEVYDELEPPPRPTFSIPTQGHVDKDTFFQWLRDEDEMVDRKRKRRYPLVCDNPKRVYMLSKRASVKRRVAEAAYDLMLHARHDKRLGKGYTKSMGELEEQLREEEDDEDDDDVDHAWEYLRTMPKDEPGAYEDEYTVENYSYEILDLTGFEWEGEDIIRLRDACEDRGAFCKIFESLLKDGIEQVIELSSP